MKGMVIRVLADSDTKAVYLKKISSKRMRLTLKWMVKIQVKTSLQVNIRWRPSLKRSIAWLT
jgi:hypothetical protein